MNETNPLEEQLQSWTPRPPTSELKTRLFGRNDSEEGVPWNRVLQWLVPATACLVAAFLLTKTEKVPGVFGNSTNSAPVFFAMVGSNTVLTPYSCQELLVASSGGNMELNVWSKASFLATNEQLWTSPRDSLTDPSATNRLQ